MENFASSTILLPEPVWALPDRPKSHLHLGCPTGGAMPLTWAHVESIKLVRSAADGQVFDTIAEVADRSRSRTRQDGPPLEVWKFNRQGRSIAAGGTLRIQAAAPFRLHWSGDGWRRVEDADSTSTGTGHGFVDVRVPLGQKAPIRFTFFWTSAGHWEGRDFQVCIEPEA
jgi:glucoamylase